MGSLRARWLGTACPPHSPCARSPRLCSRSPQPRAHPTPAGTNQLVSPLAGPGMPNNEVTGVQSPGSGGWAGRVDSTHRLSPAEAGSQRRRWASWVQVRAKFGGRKKADTDPRARPRTAGPGLAAAGFRPFPAPCKKCRQTPILTLPLSSHFSHSLRTRRPGARAVLSAREWFWAARNVALGY